MSKVLIITILAIVIIAAGATAAYILQRQEGEEVKEQPVGTIAENPKVQPPGPPPVSELKPPSQSEIDTSDWRTYRNEKYGFEVKYPKTWVGPWSPSGNLNPEGLHIAKDLPPRSVVIDIRSSGDRTLWEFANTAWKIGEPLLLSGINECKWIETNFGVPGVWCTYRYSVKTRFGEITPPNVYFETNPPSDMKIGILFPVIDPMDPYFPDFNTEIFDAIVKSFKYISKE